MLYVISYDLSIAARPDDYQRLEAALRLLGARQVLQTGWALASTRPALAIEAYLQTLMAPRDRLLVAQITPNAARTNLMNDLDQAPRPEQASQYVPRWLINLMDRSAHAES